MTIQLRPATQADAPRVVELSQALAIHEGDTLGKLSVDNFQAHGFGARPLFDCQVAECDGTVAGFIVTTPGYKFGDGAPTVWIAQMFVDPKYRRKGIARKLMAFVAQQALASGSRFMQWSVVPTNVEASRFYATLGAQENEITQNYLDEAALKDLAAKA